MRQPQFFLRQCFLLIDAYQILREINSGDSRSSKTAIFAVSEALNFGLFLANFSTHKLQKNHQHLNKYRLLYLYIYTVFLQLLPDL